MIPLPRYGNGFRFHVLFIPSAIRGAGIRFWNPGAQGDIDISRCKGKLFGIRYSENI